MDNWDGHHSAQVTYNMMSYCPGFEAPTPSEQTISAYTLPPPNQTVQDWVNKQIHRLQYHEILFHFFEVMTFYYEMDWHLPTRTDPLYGSLNLKEYDELALEFYHVPPPPEREEQDHHAIMLRLRALRYQAERIMRQVRQRAKLSLF